MKYFDPAEFDSPDMPGSGLARMQLDFLKRLDRARGLAGIPFHITSGFRSGSHNAKVGGVRLSSHTKGCAADIAATTSESRYRIVIALSRAGFRRIGIANDFIHVDSDTSKPDAIWFYGKERHLT